MGLPFLFGANYSATRWCRLEGSKWEAIQLLPISLKLFRVAFFTLIIARAFTGFFTVAMIAFTVLPLAFLALGHTFFATAAFAVRCEHRAAGH